MILLDIYQWPVWLEYTMCHSFTCLREIFHKSMSLQPLVNILSLLLTNMKNIHIHITNLLTTKWNIFIRKDSSNLTTSLQLLTDCQTSSLLNRIRENLREQYLGFTFFTPQFIDCFTFTENNERKSFFFHLSDCWTFT